MTLSIHTNKTGAGDVRKIPTGPYARITVRCARDLLSCTECHWLGSGGETLESEAIDHAQAHPGHAVVLVQTTLTEFLAPGVS